MRIVQTIATLLLVLAGGLAVVVWYINSLDNRTHVERLLEAATGFVVSIDGQMKFGLSPLPTVVAEDVRVANPPWVERPELAKVARVEVGFDLWSLLSGPLRIDSLIIHDAVIQLESDGQGRANWLAAQTGQDGGPVSAPDIRSLSFRNSLIAYRSGDPDRDYTVRIEDGTAAMPSDGPLMTTVAGQFRETDFVATVQGGRLARLVNDDTHWPIRAKIAAAGSTVELAGTIDRPLSQRALDVKTSLAGESLDAIGPLIGLWLPPIRPYAASFHLVGEGGLYRLSDFKARFADSDGAGTLDLDFRGEKPLVEGTLHAEFLRVLDLFGIAKSAEMGQAPAAAPVAGDGRLFDATPVPFETINFADAQITVTAEQVATWPMEMEAVSTVVTARDGVLSLHPLRAMMGGGRLDLRIVVDAPPLGSGTWATAAIQGRVDSVRLERLSPRLGLTVPPEGALNITVELSGRGNSLRDLMARAQGSVDFAVGPGSLPIWGFDLIATDLIQAMMPWARHGDRTPLNCMLARFTVENGFAKTNALLIDTTRITVAGAGAANLATEEIDFFFRPRPKDPSLLSVAAPVRVTGTLSAYRARPDAMDLAAKGAATLLLGSINPVAVIVPFLDVGTGIENPCLEALRPGSFITAQPVHRGPLGQTLEFFNNTFGRVFDWLPVN